MKWLLLCLLFATNTAAGPLREPAQCRVFWANIEKVTSWTDARKNDLYWQCLSRSVDWRRSTRMTIEESIELRKAWALTPAPEMTDDAQ